MTARDILRFQFGAADAIRAVAASRAALPTGILLVLLTTVARSYALIKKAKDITICKSIL